VSPHLLPEESEPETISLDQFEEEITGALTAMNLDTDRIADRFALNGGDASRVVYSFLDPMLQRYVAGLLQRSMTRQAAVVVMSPVDGRLLAMASYDDRGENENLCVRAIYPAASLFKIVSAAAALEASGYTPDHPVFFHGGKHTLYKGQLKEVEGKKAYSMSFSKAFASSVNPVFGKLGIYQLGPEVMARYAENFYFNRPIPFDFDVEESSVEVPTDPFGLAEVASGFNKRTLISPLHAALLAAVAANNGVMMEPRLIDHISTASQEVRYCSEPRILGTPIRRDTARDLRALMEETVLTGTCRKSFRPLRLNKAYRAVDLGAKTGTINDQSDKYKYDWLVAFALPPKTDEAICLSVLGVHGEKLGVRASQLARLIIQYYLTSKAVSGL
jgi:peptidoglycan glycosyltransferase